MLQDCSQSTMDANPFEFSRREWVKDRRKLKDRRHQVSCENTTPSISGSPVGKTRNLIPMGRQLSRTPPPSANKGQSSQTLAVSPKEQRNAKQLHSSKTRCGKQAVGGSFAPEWKSPGVRNGHDQSVTYSEAMINQRAECSPRARLGDVSCSRATPSRGAVKDTVASSVTSSPARKALNSIPTGKQLPRTPPSANKRRVLQTPVLSPEKLRSPKQQRRTKSSSQNQDVGGSCAQDWRSPGGRQKNLRHSGAITNRKPECSAQGAINPNTCPSDSKDLEVHDETREKALQRRSTKSFTANLSEMDPEKLVKGMQGYQWTEGDLEFVQHIKNIKLIQQLKEELSQLQKQLKGEQLHKDLLLAKKEKIQAQCLEMDTSFDQIVHLGRAFLCRTLDPATVESIPSDSVLGRVSIASVRRVCQQEKQKLQALKKKVTDIQQQTAEVTQKEQGLRNMEKHHLEEIERLKRGILLEQENVINMEKELSDLQSKLSESQEKLGSLKRQAREQKASKERKDQSHDLKGKEDVIVAKVLRRCRRLERRKELFLERQNIMKRIHVPNC
ncbi:uncharacterized protein [Lepisosteus oculatus]|uniref:uncharacterized protein n=1 Tax=Lepisosteus oculatus TaxID=7918 RepID=UPI0035F511CD